MAFRPIPGDSRRRYTDSATGEIISRRQYDKRYGTLKRQGYTSYEQKSRLRAAAGLKGKRLGTSPLKIFSINEYPRVGSRNITVRTRSNRLAETNARMLEARGMRETNVHVRVRMSGGEYRRTNVRDPRKKGIGETLSSDVATLLHGYGSDMQPTVDEYGNFDVDLVWSEGYDPNENQGGGTV